ncbi:MAG: type II toxin-antitoxin system HipA family toxin [Nitrosomonas sp.]|nr:type II toxin-antitoxin system HipA family toxin [Nitrosomonas sp.]
MSDAHLRVSTDWQGQLHRIGRLEIHQSRGREHYRFIYDQSWVRHPGRFAIDPELPLMTDVPFMNSRLWGVFEDISPDRWGRLVQTRVTGHYLSDSDYMLGVSDFMRMGALRLSHESTPDQYEAAHTRIPKLIHIRKLETAIQHLERGQETDADLAVLAQPGSSLGGARPKAAIEDAGELWIAKFASQNDTDRIGLWEAVMLDLAQQAGIDAATFRTLSAGYDQPVLLVKRFDRNRSERIPYMSAMTMLGRTEDTKAGASYLEIADAISRESAQPEQDRLELWRRMVFNAMAGNIDDHLRNHGFLRTSQGWQLAPAFDLNPTPQPFAQRVHQLAFDHRSKPSLDTCLQLAEYFCARKPVIDLTLRRIGESLGNWQSTAKRHQLRSDEIKRMAASFEHEDSQRLVAMAKQKRSHTRSQ